MDLKTLGLQGLTGQFVGADDKYITELEAWAGFRLPEGYGKFLKEYGASLFVEDVTFRPVVQSPWAVNGTESFDLFYGMSKETHADVQAINITLRGVIPKEAIAIGNDPGSNLILLEADGKTYFFDRDTGNRYLCAKDFAAFLTSFSARDTAT